MAVNVVYSRKPFESIVVNGATITVLPRSDRRSGVMLRVSDADAVARVGRAGQRQGSPVASAPVADQSASVPSTSVPSS